MSKTEAFKKLLAEGQVYKKDFIVLGTGMLDGYPVPNAQVKVPLKTMNRHGLITTVWTD